MKSFLQFLKEAVLAKRGHGRTSYFEIGHPRMKHIKGKWESKHVELFTKEHGGINEIGIPKMSKAFNQRALKTINPKNILKAPENIQKLGRTTELIGKKAGAEGASTNPAHIFVAGALGKVGQGTQAVAKKLP